MTDIAEHRATTKWHLVEVGDHGAPVKEQRTVRIAIEDTRTMVCDRGNLLEARIELRATRLGDNVRGDRTASMGGRWAAGAYKLTGGNMIVPGDSRGIGLGTYMENLVVRWALEDVRKPGRIEQISVSECDAKTEPERDRRNRFYEQFGITFVWSEPVNGIARARGRSTATLTINDVHALDVVNGARTLTLPGAFYDLERLALDSTREAERADRERNKETGARDAERAAWNKALWIVGIFAGIAGLIVGAVLAHLL